MKVIFTLLGLVLGAGMGGPAGAIVLGALGFGLAYWLQKSAPPEPSVDLVVPSEPRSAPPPARRAAPADLQTQVEILVARVERLEARLGIAPAPEPQPEPETAPPPAAQPGPQVESRAGPSPAPAMEPLAPAPAPETPPVDETAVTAAKPIDPPPPPPPLAPAEPAGPGFLQRLISENIVAKVGVVVLFFGVGFLLKFAYDRGMLPPELRLAGVLAGAGLLLFIGWRLRHSHRLYAMILQGGASGLAYLDVFFALKTYGFIGPVAGFTLFAILGVVTTMSAVRQDAPVLAVLGLIGAFMAPILASTGSGNHVLLFSYYALLNVFIFGVSWFKAWRALNLTGWIFTFAVALLWGSANYRPALFGTVEPFVLLFFALYLVIPILFATRQPPHLKGIVDGTLVFGTPAAVAVMQAGLVHDIPNGLAWSAAGGGALYAVLAASLWRQAPMRLLRETYLALAVGLGTLAIFFGFDAYPTFALWTLEGTAILWVALRQERALARWFALLVQAAGALMFLGEYAGLDRGDPVLNDAIYGCLWIAVASFMSAVLARRYRDRLPEGQRGLATLFLLWGAAWWSLGGLDAIDHAVAGELQPAAAGMFFAATFFVLELAGARAGWRELRALCAAHAPVLAIAALFQLNSGGHALGNLGFVAWPLGFGCAFWALVRQERDGVAVLPSARYLLQWATLALLATWEEFWLLREREHGLGMLLAAAAHVAAWLRFRLREQRAAAPVPASAVALLWAIAFWFVQGAAWSDARFGHAGMITAMLGLAAASAFVYELAGARLGWRVLRHAAWVAWAGMLVAAAAQIEDGLRPWASYGWLAWPAAFAAAYLSLFRQERDGIALGAPLAHVAGLWLAVLVAGRELTSHLADWGFGSAWTPAVWGSCLAAALGGSVAWGNLGWWPVAPRRALYRDAALGPVALLSAAWFLYINLRAPGDMAPLPYLPLANPIDLACAAALAAGLSWSRWLSALGSAAQSFVQRVAWGLGFVWLNGVALRSIHFWAGVPYRLDRLLESVLVQATLSLLWSGTALALMLVARRRSQRALWVVGAGLLAVVVAKLFVVDLANTGTVARIVSFIGVGALLLVIGYAAPVPPAAAAQDAPREPS
ncbi:MAG TPA: DUF2339 domain-containing protein [Burkholderiales bacterium]|nr:DUF2339 domain-containing protein [Burkholderiales bacterium]